MSKLFGGPVFQTPNHRRCARSRCRDWGGSTLRRWTCLIEREGGLGSATNCGADQAAFERFSDDGSSSVFEWRRALDVEGGGVFGRGCCHGDGFERAGRHHSRRPTRPPGNQLPARHPRQ